jgi:hypothetical protein
MIGQDRTGQDRTGQDRTGQDRTGQNRDCSVQVPRFGADCSSAHRRCQAALSACSTPLATATAAAAATAAAFHRRCEGIGRAPECGVG